MLDVQSLGIFTAKYSTKQGVTFVIECLLGIGLIFLPDLVNKFLKLLCHRLSFIFTGFSYLFQYS